MSELPRLDQRTPLLVGREREQEVLRECLASVLDGRGHLVLIGGEVGIGKTTLARHLCQEATKQGALVLSGQTDLLAETPPYGPWVEIFAHAPACDDISPPTLGTSTGETTNLSAIFSQVRDYLTALSNRQPVVVLLEDFHWSDPASLDLLRFLSRDLPYLPLLFVATYRADELTRQHPLSLQIPVLVRQAGALRLDLRRLEPDDMRELVSTRYTLSEEDADRLLAYLEERATGNPLYIDEILRALEQEQLLTPDGDGWALSDLSRFRVPSLLRQVIDERVMRLGEETYDLLSIAAVIGHEVRLSLWSSVSGVPEEQLIDVVETAVEARLLDAAADGTSVSFAHALIRESLYEEILPPRRRLRHRKVADALLETQEPDPDAIAYHLQRSGDPRAAEWLIKAGTRAQNSYALLTAAKRFGAALELLEAQGASDAQRAELMYRIARMRRYADPRQSLHYLDDALALAESASDSVLTAYLRCFRGGLLCGLGDLLSGLTEMQAGLSGIGALEPAERRRLRELQERLGEPPDEYQFRGSYANWLASVGRAGEAIDEGKIVVASEPAPGIGTSGYANAWRGLASAYALLGKPDEARRACTRASDTYRAVKHPYQVGNARLLELFEVVLPYQADDLTERRRLAEEAEEAWTRASGATVDLPPRFVWLPLLLIEGEWHEARELAHSARIPTRRRGWRPFATTLLALLAFEQGDFDSAWQLIREQLPDGPDASPGNGIYLDVVPLQRLATNLSIETGDLDTARAWLEAHERWLSWSGAVLGRAEGYLTWASYFRAIGDPAEAIRDAQRALEEASDPLQPLVLLASRRMLGELELAAGNHESAKSHLDAALTLADACQARYQRALTLTSLAELHAAEGRAADAETSLDDARAILTELGAGPALARLDAIAARMGAGPDARPTFPAGLTAREMEVLRLVVEGRTDREIADQLFISPRTVTTHITNILNKLDVGSRTAAATHAVREGIV